MPLWKLGTATDLFVYLDERKGIEDFKTANLIWREQNIKFGDYSAKNKGNDHRVQRKIAE